MSDVRRCATEIALVHNTKPTCAVVGLHGYAGYPGELALPGKLLFAEGFDFFACRYPGHGTSGSDFMQSESQDWLARAEEQIEWVLERYKKICLIGHSMGGAMALIMAAKYPIKKMVLYAPALRLPRALIPMLRLAAPFTKRIKRTWAPDERYQFFDERDEDDDLYLGSEYWSYIYVRQMLELEKIRRQALQALPKVKTDTLVLTGGEDFLVSERVGQTIVDQGLGKNRALHFANAGHYIPYDKDESSRQEAMEATLTWFHALKIEAKGR